MKLPKNSIGVSDLKDWQECPRRMSFQMQRHEAGEDPPEAAVNPNVRYGKAIHDAIEHVEKTDCTNEEAVQYLMSNGHRWLDPEVIQEIKEDLDIYREREPLGVRTVMAEGEIRVPLLVHPVDDGTGNKVPTQIYYRAKIDRLYESLARPGVFYMRDYKSSRWPRTKKEIDEDKQMSSYDWSVREFFPEIEELWITYDQLKYGEIETSRNDNDRQWIVEWLRMAVIAVLDDEEYGPDGLLVPEFNNWCPYCPIAMSCAVVPKLTRYAQAEIAKLAPSEKSGRSTIVQLDEDLFDVYVDQLEDVSTAKAVLERFEKAIKARLMELPLHEREAYGYTLRSRNVDVFSNEALAAAHRLLGDKFYEVATVSKTALERATGSDRDKLNLIVGMADRRPGSRFVARKSKK